MGLIRQLSEFFAAWRYSSGEGCSALLIAATRRVLLTIQHAQNGCSSSAQRSAERFAQRGQMAAAPACATKSPSISTVAITNNPSMGASRMRPATTAVDAQFRTLLIAPSRIPGLFALPAQT